MLSIPPTDALFRRPAAEWGGAFDLPEPMPEPIAEKHAIHQTAHADYVAASNAWAAYSDAHQRPEDEDLNALADAINADAPTPAATVVGELTRLHDAARLAARRLDRSRLNLAWAIVEHRDAYLEALVENMDRTVAEYRDTVANLERLGRDLGTRASAVDFVRDFDVEAFEWVTFEVRARRFRIVREGLPVTVDLDLDADVLAHLRADVDAMVATFGTFENEPDDAADALDDRAGLEMEPDAPAGDAE